MITTDRTMIPPTHTHKALEDHSGTLHAAINRLDEALADGTQPMQKLLAEILHDLIDYSVAEFRSQEKFMRGIAYDGYEDHVSMHQTFSQQIRQHMAQYLAGHKIAADLLSYLRDWVSSHVHQTDAELHEVARSRMICG